MFIKNFRRCSNVKVDVTVNGKSIGVHVIREAYLTRPAYDLLVRDANYVFKHNKDGLQFEGVPGDVFDADVKGYRNKRALRVSVETLMDTPSIMAAIESNNTTA